MWDKYKGILEDDALFYGLLILLVGVSSFGLGRWSIAEEVPKTQAANVQFTQTPEKVVESESVTVGASAPTVNTQGQYVASKNSNKYHLPWCSGAKRIKEENKVWFQSKEEAASKGYTPAANCPSL